MTVLILRPRAATEHHLNLIFLAATIQSDPTFCFSNQFLKSTMRLTAVTSLPDVLGSLDRRVARVSLSHWGDVGRRTKKCRGAHCLPLPSLLAHPAIFPKLPRRCLFRSSFALCCPKGNGRTKHGQGVASVMSPRHQPHGRAACQLGNVRVIWAFRACRACP